MLDEPLPNRPSLDSPMLVRALEPAAQAIANLDQALDAHPLRLAFPLPA